MRGYFELIAYAREQGMRAVLSTNGTLITPPMLPHELKEFGLSYVGVSLDGLEETNDRFRGMKALSHRPGGYPQLPAGRHQSRTAIYHESPKCAGYSAASSICCRREKIPRICFYHLVYAGRGHETCRRCAHPRRIPARR